MQDQLVNSTTLSIFDGVDALIDSALHLTGDAASGRTAIGKAPHHGHSLSCQRLSKNPPVDFNAAALVTNLYEKIGGNWDTSIYHKGSEENWRFDKQKRIAEKNRSPEVRLERMIVNARHGLLPDPDSWVNQVPVASGLVSVTADRSCKIDLVHECGNNTYEFIELKVRRDTNTPLYAAMEILKYGVVYVFCRHDTRVPQSIFKNRKLLEADRIQLRVLAPARYYDNYDLSWLEMSLNEGIATFRTEQQLSFEMDFKFETLSLIARSPVKWGRLP
jgi:hypothetical protein